MPLAKTKMPRDTPALPEHLPASSTSTAISSSGEASLPSAKSEEKQEKSHLYKKKPVSKEQKERVEKMAKSRTPIYTKTPWVTHGDEKGVSRRGRFTVSPASESKSDKSEQGAVKKPEGEEGEKEPEKEEHIPAARRRRGGRSRSRSKSRAASRRSRKGSKRSSSRRMSTSRSRRSSTPQKSRKARRSPSRRRARGGKPSVPSATEISKEIAVSTSPAAVDTLPSKARGIGEKRPQERKPSDSDVVASPPITAGDKKVATKLLPETPEKPAAKAEATKSKADETKTIAPKKKAAKRRPRRTAGGVKRRASKTGRRR